VSELDVCLSADSWSVDILGEALVYYPIEVGLLDKVVGVVEGRRVLV
jgi:hypothetical protein